MTAFIIFLRRVLLLAGGLLGATLPLAAQTRPDSTALRYEEETVVVPTTPPAPATTQVQERHLFKLGFNNLLLLPDNVSRQVSSVSPGIRYERYGLHLAYEQKLGAAWTGLAEASPYLLSYTPDNARPGRERGVCLRAQVAARYYYNLGRRLRRGRPAGNFSGNYVALALGGGFGERAHETAFFYYAESRVAARFDAALLYGLQRRLGRLGFVDASVGLPLALSSGASTQTYYLSALLPTLAFNLRLGLCLGR